MTWLRSILIVYFRVNYSTSGYKIACKTFDYYLLYKFAVCSSGILFIRKYFTNSVAGVQFSSAKSRKVVS